MSSPRFMQTLGQGNYDELQQIAENKGIKLQELIRTIIIPEWLEQHRKKEE